MSSVKLIIVCLNWDKAQLEYSQEFEKMYERKYGKKSDGWQQSHRYCKFEITEAGSWDKSLQTVATSICRKGLAGCSSFKAKMFLFQSIIMHGRHLNGRHTVRIMRISIQWFNAEDFFNRVRGQRLFAIDAEFSQIFRSSHTGTQSGVYRSCHHFVRQSQKIQLGMRVLPDMVPSFDYRINSSAYACSLTPDALRYSSGTMLIHIWHVRHVYVYAHMCARARLFVMRLPAAPRRRVIGSVLSDSPRGI